MLSRLIERSRSARTALVLLVFPPVYLADRLRGVQPPVSLRRGLAWAKTGEAIHEPTIPIAAKPARVRQRGERRPQ